MIAPTLPAPSTGVIATTTPASGLLPGSASVAGTKRFRLRFADRYTDDFYRPVAGVLASSIGLGTYLGECTDAEDARYAGAVGTALDHGINLLDCAINYRCQRSERAVGEALRQAIASGAVARDEVVLCSKAGYIPLDATAPETREAYQAYVTREFYEPGLMTLEDVVAGGHCLAPAFLEHQIRRSRQNLGVGTVDVFYLHNPEQQLDVVSPEMFRTIMREAFAVLEERVQAGEIGQYGCATWNGFRVAPGAKSHISLGDLVALAREVGGPDHHFRVIQLPINLAMPEALRGATQPVDGDRVVPLLQAAADLGMSVVASATLMQSQLTRGLPAALADAFPALRTDAQRAIAFVRSLPGVSTALVGMKSAAHVTENLGAAARLPR